MMKYFYKLAYKYLKTDMLEKDPLVKFIWYLQTDMIQQDPIVQNPRKGSFNTTACFIHQKMICLK